MRYIILDLEYNQISNKGLMNNEIIEVGAIYFRNLRTITHLNYFHSTCKPIGQMNKKILKLTGITKSELMKARSFRKIAADIEKWLEGYKVTLLTWGESDYPVFLQNYYLHNLRLDWVNGVINLQNVVEDLFGLEYNISLENSYNLFDMEKPADGHRAFEDAKKTLKLIPKIYDKCKEQDISILNYKRNYLIRNPLLAYKRDDVVLSKYGDQVYKSFLKSYLKSKLNTKNEISWEDFIITRFYLNLYNHYKFDKKTVDIFNKNFKITVKSVIKENEILAKLINK